MTEDTDIRAALEGFAALAPDPERLRSTLDGRIRAHRQRRLILAGAATVAGAAAVGVPAVLLTRHHAPDVPALPPPTPEPSPHAGNTRLPLRLRATWLPEGILELTRAIGPDPYREQHFYGQRDSLDNRSDTPPFPPSIALTVTDVRDAVGYPNYPGDNGEAVRIGDHSGVLKVVENAITIDWSLRDGLYAHAQLFGLDKNREIALRFARGVADDSGTGIEVALDFGWLSPTFQPTVEVTSLGGTRGHWVHSVSRNRAATEYVEARLGLGPSRDPLIATGNTVTVRGRPALLNALTGLIQIVQQLDGGHWLYLQSNLDNRSTQTALHIMEGLYVGADPYTGWMS